MPPTSRLARFVVAALIAVLAVALGTGSLAQAADPVATTVTITSSATVTAGQKATVKGRLTDVGGHAVKAATVTVRWRVNGTSAWRWSKSVTTDNRGAWSTTVMVGHNTQFVAEYASSAGTLGSTSAVATTIARQSVVIGTVSPARPGIGQLMTVSGTVSKGLRNTTISLQWKKSGQWSTIRTTTATRTGTYAFTLRITDGATLVLRTQSVRSDRISLATSGTRTISIAVSATLYTGGRLDARRLLSSPNGLYVATMQADGNLVVRSGTRTVWSSGTKGSGNAVRISTAGNLTVGTGTKTVWSAGTNGKVARLVLQNDGNLVLWSKGRTLWSATRGKGVQVAPALCWSTSFDCISWTGYVPSTNYWRMYAGHNCTNYAAYRMILKGITDPPWGYPGGSAWQWSGGAKKAKVKIDKVPAVGAVMQWNRNTHGGGGSGHVVYVEKVTPTSVIISEDSWSSHASVRVINRTSSAYRDAQFIHFADGA